MDEAQPGLHRTVVGGRVGRIDGGLREGDRVGVDGADLRGVGHDHVDGRRRAPGRRATSGPGGREARYPILAGQGAFVVVAEHARIEAEQGMEPAPERAHLVDGAIVPDGARHPAPPGDENGLRGGPVASGPRGVIGRTALESARREDGLGAAREREADRPLLSEHRRVGADEVDGGDAGFGLELAEASLLLRCQREGRRGGGEESRLGQRGRGREHREEKKDCAHERTGGRRPWHGTTRGGRSRTRASGIGLDTSRLTSARIDRVQHPTA